MDGSIWHVTVTGNNDALAGSSGINSIGLMFSPNDYPCTYLTGFNTSDGIKFTDTDPWVAVVPWPNPETAAFNSIWITQSPSQGVAPSGANQFSGSFWLYGPAPDFPGVTSVSAVFEYTDPNGNVEGVWGNFNGPNTLPDRGSTLGLLLVGSIALLFFATWVERRTGKTACGA
jgi:hypothetical protein